MSRNKDRKLPELAYDRMADCFDSVMNEYDIQRRLEVLIEDFLCDVDLHYRLVLDAGCGTGRATRALAARGAHVVALDLGLNLARYTRSRLHVPAVAGSILTLPFNTSTFDVVLSSEVIEHVSDPLAAVEELYRVLKPAGHLVLSTPNRLWQWPVRVASQLRLRPYEGLEQFVYPRQLKAKYESLGACVVEHRGLHLLPFQLKTIQPLLRLVDRWGGRLLPVMINQCIHITKTTDD